ncbi:MAG TPA: hypothetical protein VFA76_06570 [Terriglobales bacterium]|nr:hypothetical protein [Terriglobales bacterium]
MKRSLDNNQRGVALLICLFSLMIITAIALGMMYMGDTELRINDNYRNSQKAYAASRAGLEEARDRMQLGSPFPITRPAKVPVPTGDIVYLLNPAGATDPVQPWNVANPYFDTELCQEGFPGLGLADPGPGVQCNSVPAGAGWYTTVNSISPFTNTAAALNYKWVRISLKTNSTAEPVFINGSAAAGTAGTQACWTGKNEVLLPVGKANCAAAGYVDLYVLTSLAVMPNGSRRMTHMEIAPAVPVPVQGAIYSNLAQNYGDALNVTGNTDPVCSAPSVYGGVSGSTITTPGGGNITGSPAGTKANATPFPYNLNPADPTSIVSVLQAMAQPIDAAGTGVTGSGSPATYTGPHATLGTIPTVTYNGNGDVTAISAPGTSKMYYSPGNLTLGTNTIGGAPVNGQGVLVVNGNLTLNITNGMNYFGLIIVTGNITMTANGAVAAGANFHGAIINGGTFSAPMSNLSGSVFVHQNACMVQKGLDMPLNEVASSELPY